MPVSRPGAVGGDDNGFTIVEVLVAIAVISTTMLSLGPLFVITMKVNHQQSNRQSAIQAADDAMERARALQVSALLTGRDLESTRLQAVAAPDEVKKLLAGNLANAASLATEVTARRYLAFDEEAGTGAGPSAILPTTFNPIVLSGVQYRQNWFVGRCGRISPATDGLAESVSRPCLAGELGVGYVPLYRVVVSVGWTDRFCPTECTYVTSTLISSKTQEPVFSIRDSISRVKITTVPSAQTNTVTGVLNPPLAFTADGTGVVWKATGLPAGLSIDPVSGTISGTPTTAATYATQVTATDAYGQEDYVTFGWVIRPVPAVASQGTISIPGGTAYTKTFTATNGTTPYTWSWSGTPTAAWPTGTPPGLSLDPATGTVSGTPNVTGSTSVTVTVTDRSGVTGTRTFTWTVPVLSINNVTLPASSKIGTAISPLTVVAAGGVTPYTTWSDNGTLPAGLSINPATGVISGTPTGPPKTYPNVTITVTDSSANTAARSVSKIIGSWRVVV